MVERGGKSKFESNTSANAEKNSPGSTTNLGEGEQHTPHLALVAQTILADELELRVTAEKKIPPLAGCSQRLEQENTLLLSGR
jgi:hypothetical protein